MSPGTRGSLIMPYWIPIVSDSRRRVPFRQSQMPMLGRRENPILEPKEKLLYTELFCPRKP